MPYSFEQRPHFAFEPGGKNLSFDVQLEFMPMMSLDLSELSVKVRVRIQVETIDVTAIFYRRAGLSA